jgi:uncharacterized protein YkwD
MGRRIAVVVGLVALTAQAVVAGGQGGATPAPVTRPRVTGESRALDGQRVISELERVVIDGINAERAAYGLPPLVVSVDLTDAARAFSRDMAESRFFGHVDLEGRTVANRVEDAGIDDWKNVGENIARNRGFGDPAVAAVREWMKSEPHRLNILNTRFRETGVGVWIGLDRTYYFTQIFLVRKKKG